MTLQKVFSFLSETQYDLAIKRNTVHRKKSRLAQQREDCGTGDRVAFTSIPRVLKLLFCCFNQGFNVLLSWFNILCLTLVFILLDGVGQRVGRFRCIFLCSNG